MSEAASERPLAEAFAEALAAVLLAEAIPQRASRSAGPVMSIADPKALRVSVFLFPPEFQL